MSLLCSPMVLVSTGPLAAWWSGSPFPTVSMGIESFLDFCESLSNPREIPSSDVTVYIRSSEMLRVPSPLKEHNKSCPVAGSVAFSPLHSQQLVWMSCPATWVTHHFMCASITVAPLRKIHGRHSHRALQVGCAPPHSAAHSGSLLTSARSLNSSV